MTGKEGVRRVVWLPKELDDQVEQFRKEIGYSRSATYRYMATRFLEEKLLSKRRKIHLRPWEEVIGKLKAIETNSDAISAVITCTQDVELVITYPRESPEAVVLRSLTNLLGEKVSVIRTDHPEKPLIVKPIKSPSNRHNHKPRNFTNTITRAKSPEK